MKRQRFDELAPPLAAAAISGIEATALVMTAHHEASVAVDGLVCELELLVSAPGRAPLPVRRTEVLDGERATALLPGATLTVRIDAGDATSVWIDWGRSIQ